MIKSSGIYHPKDKDQIVFFYINLNDQIAICEYPPTQFVYLQKDGNTILSHWNAHPVHEEQSSHI